MKVFPDILIFSAFLLLSCLGPKKVTVASQTGPSLFGTYWKLIELNGAPVGLTSREPHLILNQAENRANGNGGCNSFFGNIQHSEGRISFSGIGSTKMACPGLPVENEYFKALETVQSYTLKGDVLTLGTSDENPVATFVAVEKAAN